MKESKAPTIVLTMAFIIGLLFGLYSLNHKEVKRSIDVPKPHYKYHVDFYYLENQSITYEINSWSYKDGMIILDNGICISGEIVITPNK